MSYQKNRLLNHHQSHFTIFFAKNHIVYMIFSCAFWIVTIGVSWINSYDPFLGETLSIYKLDSIFFIFHLILYFIFIIGLCVLIGTILSIPAILGRGVLDYLILLERKKYKRVFYLVFSAQYLPYILLIVFNGLFYYANTSTKIYNGFLADSTLEKIRKNYELIGQKNQNGYYVFLIPEYLLENDQKLLKTKSILPSNGKFFLESVSKPEIVAMLIHQESNNIMQYYSPAPIKDEFQSEVSQTQLTIGIDRKHTPEFLNLYSKNILETKRFHLTKSTLLSNRAIASLTPIHLVLKSNVLGIMGANWRWENFGNTSLDILSKQSSSLKQKKAALYNFVFLSDLEPVSQKSLFIGSTDFLNKTSVAESEQNLDRNLHIAIKSLLNSGAKNIALLPYQTTTGDFKISSFFTTMRVDNNLKSYRTFFRNYDDPFVCKSQYVQNHNESLSFNHTMLMDNLKFSKNGIPYLNSEYGFYIKQFFSNVLFCYENKENIYVLNKSEATNAAIGMAADESWAANDLNIYKISNISLPYLLTKEEKNNFIYKYKYEIFK